MFFNFVGPFLVSSDFSGEGEGGPIGVSIMIQPAGYCFSIWFVIYSLIAVFVVYQALPDPWVPKRTDDVIFEKMGLLFAANMGLNGLWLIIFSQFGTVWYILGGIEIVFLTASTVWIMMISTRNKLSWTEVIGLRAAFSIYGGWLTAATILNFSIILKDLGMSDESENMVLTEEFWTGLMLWIAFAVYLTATLTENNPLFGAIYVWVLVGLIVEQRESLTIVINASIIVSIHAFILIGWASYLVLNKRDKSGLFYF